MAPIVVGVDIGGSGLRARAVHVDRVFPDRAAPGGRAPLNPAAHGSRAHTRPAAPGSRKPLTAAAQDSRQVPPAAHDGRQVPPPAHDGRQAPPAAHNSRAQTRPAARESRERAGLSAQSLNPAAHAGRVLAERTLPGPVVINGPVLAPVVGELVRSLGVDRPAAVAIGCAGVATFGAALRDPLAAAVDAECVAVCSDLLTAYAGGLGLTADELWEHGGTGVVLAAGTGAVAFGGSLRHGWRRADGWGHLLGDEGGGAWIGRAGMRAALRALDGRPGGSVTLLDLLRLRVGEPSTVITNLTDHADRAGALAAFAPSVIEAAASGDPVAARIVDEAATHLADTAAAAHLANMTTSAHLMDTTAAAHPTDTTAAAQPADTPPTDTTAAAPPTDTTAAAHPTDTTAAAPPTDTTTAVHPKDTAAVHPTDATTATHLADTAAATHSPRQATAAGEPAPEATGSAAARADHPDPPHPGKPTVAITGGLVRPGGYLAERLTAALHARGLAPRPAAGTPLGGAVVLATAVRLGSLPHALASAGGLTVSPRT